MKEAAISLFAALCFAGCATSPTTRLQVSGDGGQGFSARVETSNHHVLTVGTVTKHNEQHEVVQTTGEIVACDLHKEKKSAHMVAEIVQDGRVVVRAEAPPGAEGVRFEKVAGDWKQRTY